MAGTGIMSRIKRMETIYELFNSRRRAAYA
nr:MAG TPA: hypothetical protein [Bacteriophage sp.]